MFKKRFGNNDTVPYIHERFAVVINRRLHYVPDLLQYGHATHALYRSGTILYLRIIEPALRDELYDELEFTIAHDPRSSFLCEV